MHSAQKLHQFLLEGVLFVLLKEEQFGHSGLHQMLFDGFWCLADTQQDGPIAHWVWGLGFRVAADEIKRIIALPEADAISQHDKYKGANSCTQYHNVRQSATVTKMSRMCNTISQCSACKLPCTHMCFAFICSECLVRSG